MSERRVAGVAKPSTNGRGKLVNYCHDVMKLQETKPTEVVPNSIIVSAFYWEAMKWAGDDVTTVSELSRNCERAEMEGTLRSWNAGVHPHEVMRIKGSLHREEGTM